MRDEQIKSLQILTLDLAKGSSDVVHLLSCAVIVLLVVSNDEHIINRFEIVIGANEKERWLQMLVLLCQRRLPLVEQLEGGNDVGTF